MKFECYPLSEKNLFLKIITEHTEEGTLYRLASAIFALGLDIHSGEIRTIRKGTKKFSEDSFILRGKGELKSFSDFSYQLGILMESVLNHNQEPERILSINPERSIPSWKEIFSEDFEYIIEEMPQENCLLFHFETTDRSGLLLAISEFFYRNNINIIEAKIETDYSQIAKDTFYLEYRNASTTKFLKKELEKFISADASSL